MKIFLDNEAAKLSQQILQEKLKFEAEGKSPRLLLVDEKNFQILEEDWIGEAKDLPWGDSLVYEIEKRRRHGGKMFLGDGTFLDLWVVRVDTINGFRVY